MLKGMAEMVCTIHGQRERAARLALSDELFDEPSFRFGVGGNVPCVRGTFPRLLIAEWVALQAFDLYPTSVLPKFLGDDIDKYAAIAVMWMYFASVGAGQSALKFLAQECGVDVADTPDFRDVIKLAYKSTYRIPQKDFPPLIVPTKLFREELDSRGDVYPLFANSVYSDPYVRPAMQTYPPGFEHLQKQAAQRTTRRSTKK